MPAPAAEPAPPKTELQELQHKAQEKTDEVSFPRVTTIKFDDSLVYFSPSSPPAACWRFAKRWDLLPSNYSMSYYGYM